MPFGVLCARIVDLIDETVSMLKMSTHEQLIIYVEILEELEQSCFVETCGFYSKSNHLSYIRVIALGHISSDGWMSVQFSLIKELSISLEFEGLSNHFCT